MGYKAQKQLVVSDFDWHDDVSLKDIVDHYQTILEEYPNAYVVSDGQYEFFERLIVVDKH